MFIGPYEHHSNELPWRESIADVVVIPEDLDGHIDLDAARGRAGRATPTGRCKIGSSRPRPTSPASSRDTAPDRRAAARARRAVVLGLRRRRAVRRHRHVRPTATSPAAYKDAIFLSPHKFIGGPGTPGRPGRAARAADQPRAGRARAAAPSPTSTRRAPLPRRPGAPRGGRHAGDRRVDPRRPGVPAQGGRRHRRDPRARGALPAPRDRAPGTPNPTHRDPRQPRRRAAVDRLVRRPAPTAAGTCTTTSSSRCSTTCSASSPAAAARAPARTGTGCSASTSSARTSSSARSPPAARASSRAGCGSTSTTSSPRRCSSTSSTPCASSPRDGWRLLADYRFDPATGLWRHRDGPVEPPMRLHQVGYDADGVMATRATHERAPESALPGYLEEARGSSRSDREDGRRAGDGRPVSADFEHLRWFELPAACLRRLSRPRLRARRPTAGASRGPRHSSKPKDGPCSRSCCSSPSSSS